MRDHVQEAYEDGFMRGREIGESDLRNDSSVVHDFLPLFREEARRGVEAKDLGPAHRRYAAYLLGLARGYWHGGSE